MMQQNYKIYAINGNLVLWRFSMPTVTLRTNHFELLAQERLEAWEKLQMRAITAEAKLATVDKAIGWKAVHENKSLKRQLEKLQLELDKQHKVLVARLASIRKWRNKYETLFETVLDNARNKR